MYTAIGPEALGIRGLSLSEAVALTRDSGFAGLCAPIRFIAEAVDERGVDAVREEFTQAGVRPAHWNLPVAWRDDAQYESDLRDLPRLAAVAREMGQTRSATFMPSGSDERAFQENFAWHVARLRPIAEILCEEGIRFGIEYIGPKTYRDAFRHEFISVWTGDRGDRCAETEVTPPLPHEIADRWWRPAVRNRPRTRRRDRRWAGAQRVPPRAHG